MNRDLSNYRKSYEKRVLALCEVPKDPMVLFKRWFDAVDSYFTDKEVNAMTLATVGSEGHPRARVVLLKQYSNAGFVFYTNYGSEKGRAIAQNPKVCLSFFWEGAEQQVIVEGWAEKVSDRMSDEYFASRPRGSQLGAVVSHQSEVIEDRCVLDKRLEVLREKYEKQPIVRPKTWGGYLVKPTKIEFWQGRCDRLHDRIRYTLQPNCTWKIERLSP